MAIFEDDRPKPQKEHVIGSDLSLLSVEELADRIGRLKEEIARLEAAMAAKQDSRGAAESLFRKK